MLELGLALRILGVGPSLDLESYISLHCEVLISYLVCNTETNVFILHTTQLLAQPGNCDWLEQTFQMRAEWRSV